MTAALIATNVSVPCASARHQRCQLGHNCACPCHTELRLVVAEPDLAELLREWASAVKGEIIVPVEAHKFVAHLRDTKPEVLQAWLDEHAEVFVADLLVEVAAELPRRNRKVSAFADMAREFEDGNDRALLDLPYIVDADLHRRPLRDMTYSDFEFPIARLERYANAQLMQAAYLRAVRKCLPADDSLTVGEVLTEDQVAEFRPE